MLKQILNLIIVLLGLLEYSFAQYNIHSLPHPKSRGQEYFVSNPDHIISSDIELYLNNISQSIDSLSGAEYAIILVDDYEGEDDFEFALALFNSWGVGKKESNNGLLLFIAKDKRQFRFISGYGMERIFPDAYLKRIGEKYLVPNFRDNNFDKGVTEASELFKRGRSLLIT